jgi:hypothetical protein
MQPDNPLIPQKEQLPSPETGQTFDAPPKRLKLSREKITQREIDDLNDRHERIMRSAAEVAREIIELGERLSSVKARCVIRVTYSVQSRPEKQPGEGRPKRPHWVRGHLRNQAYGPPYSLHKITWIEPFRTGQRMGEN